MGKIHETAIIHKGAKIAESAEIGPYCVVSEHVEIGEGTILESSVCVDGHTNIGNNNVVSPYVSIGKPPQDLKYNGEPTKVIIGDNNKFREFVTVNCGTITGNGETVIGNSNMLMAYSHVAHDCILMNNVVMANSVALAGHVTLEDNVVLGGFTGVTQFNTIGKHAYIGAYSLIRSDFPPFFTGKGLDDFKVQSVNSVGLSRRGISDDSIRKLKNAFKLLYMKKGILLDNAVSELKTEENSSEEVEYLINFIEKSKNGIVR